MASVKWANDAKSVGHRETGTKPKRRNRREEGLRGEHRKPRVERWSHAGSWRPSKAGFVVQSVLLEIIRPFCLLCLRGKSYSFESLFLYIKNKMVCFHYLVPNITSYLYLLFTIETLKMEDTCNTLSYIVKKQDIPRKVTL